MSENGRGDVAKRGDRDVKFRAEGTRPGQSLTPLVDIFEDQEKITLIAEMPGVNAERLKLDLNEGILRIRGDAVCLCGKDEVPVAEEFRPTVYEREFKIAQNIDQGKIEAKMRNGMLTLVLPKNEAARPRQIQIQSA